MMENDSTTPYIIQIEEPFQSTHLSEELNNVGIEIGHNSELTTLGMLNNPQIMVESAENPIEIVQETTEFNSQRFGFVNQEEQPYIVQIVYPQDLCLGPKQSAGKRGRPKKKQEKPLATNDAPPPPEVKRDPPKSARTRSGRLVKLPKYIEKDFKKIETTTQQHDLQVSDFERFEEKENSKVEFPEIQTRKRVISAQYKCPKCFKAYLGKNKMIQHLKKYPDHGPLPEGYQEFNFDVWNYLFDITQKCKSGQRGVKFCEELSNLLHNVQLLKSALFKTVTDNKNCVHIDKVLGNAIGLSPGKYKFDENELYKDVTVFKLITNSDFFKPNVNNKQVSDSTVAKVRNIEDVQLDNSETKKLKRENQQQSDVNFTVAGDNHQQEISKDVDTPVQGVVKCAKSNERDYNYSPKSVGEESKPTKVEETEIADSFSKKIEVDSQILPSDLLSDNLLLQSLPNPRNSVEDLILPVVDNGSNILDNSTSSDELMNVDQFVNERFKKIIGPDIELGNTSLNLDLPSLELFQFHTS